MFLQKEAYTEQMSHTFFPLFPYNNHPESFLCVWVVTARIYNGKFPGRDWGRLCWRNMKARLLTKLSRRWNIEIKLFQVRHTIGRMFKYAKTKIPTLECDQTHCNNSHPHTIFSQNWLGRLINIFQSVLKTSLLFVVCFFSSNIVWMIHCLFCLHWVVSLFYS